ncbi:MAG: hydrogenase maturation nickel metallochaperone HypA [Chloroflexales bacterium]|nr:hydrogenase maturation nickel metallochaperone HypA [Chloroflexales bacterium]
MHELSIMASLLDTVEDHARRAGAHRVRAINLVIGERASFVDDSLLFYFDMLTPGRLCDGAALHIRRTPMSFYCAACQQCYAPSGESFRCPICATVGQITSDGRELLIESMEVEV